MLKPLARSLALAALAASAAPAVAAVRVVAAPAAAAAASPSSSTDPAALLPGFAPDTAIDAPSARAVLATMPDGCAADPRLPFERTCQHTTASDNPSPWPDFVLGVNANHVVALVLMGPAHHPAPGWRCQSLADVPDARVCTAPSVDAGMHEAWKRAWARFFSAAG